MSTTDIATQDLRGRHPDDDTETLPQLIFMPVFVPACVAWPTATVLEILHLFGVVSQRAPIVAACIPFFPWLMFIVIGLPALFLCCAPPVAYRAMKRCYHSDIVRKRRVRRRVRRSTSKGDVLTYWHRQHHEALEAGCDPPEAVRRADRAVLRR